MTHSSSSLDLYTHTYVLCYAMFIQRKWTVEGDMVSFNTSYDKSVHVDHEKLTSAALVMASDLERIV